MDDLGPFLRHLLYINNVLYIQIRDIYRSCLTLCSVRPPLTTWTSPLVHQTRATGSQEEAYTFVFPVHSITPACIFADP